MSSRTGWLIRAVLVSIAVAGLWMAWWRYPAQNRFSILRCTISFLGSPDSDRNPRGWRFYQTGMTAVLVLVCDLVAKRHRRLRPRIGRTSLWSSGAIFLALTLVLASVWIPDTRHGSTFGFRTGTLHTRMAILAIPIMAAGIVLDGVALRISGVTMRQLWPFHLYGLLVTVGTVELVTWEKMCRQNPKLSHWPGDGLHSTPLWEWVVFTYLIGFMLWMAHGRLTGESKP